MSSKTTKIIFADQTGQSIEIDKTRFFIGSSSCNDLVTDQSEHIESIHSMLYIENNQLFIQDLKTKSGVFINGVRTDFQKLTLGDQISIGTMTLDILDLQLHQNIERASMNNEFIEQSISEHFEFDDTFNHNSFNIAQFKQLNPLDYIDVQNEDDQVKASSSQIKNIPCLEIVTVVGENVIEQNVLPIQENTVTIGKKSKQMNINLFPLGSKLVCDLGEELSFFAIDEFELLDSSYNIHSKELIIPKTSEEVICYRKGSLAIFIKFKMMNSTLLPAELFERDKQFYKDTAKVFCACFLPLLLLLLVDIKPPEPKKEVAIIYKLKPSESTQDHKVATSEVTQEIDKGSGEKTPEKSKVQEKQNMRKKSQTKPTQVAKAEPAPKKVVKKKFSFKGLSNLKSLQVENNTMDIAQSSTSTTSDSSSSLKLAARAPAGTDAKNAGVDRMGTGNFTGTTAGEGGLSSKKGYDTSYIEPRTVVLGSMDPELLRKILQEYIPQFRHCYQKELLSNEDIKGILDLNFRISQNGKASKIDIKTKDSRFSRKGLDCMQRVLTLINFPKPKGGGVVDVRQPLNFMAERRQI